MQAVPYSFVRTLETSLEEMKAIPLWGAAPPLSLDALQTNLSTVLGEAVALTISEPKTIAREKLLVGLGKEPLQIALHASSLATPLFLLMAREEMEKFSKKLLKLSCPVNGETYEGFFRFTLAEILGSVAGENFFGDLSFHITEESLQETTYTLFDISLKMGRNVIASKLALPPAFISEYRSYFSTTKPSLLDSPLASATIVALRIEVGSTTLSSTEWQKAAVGDLLLLERCTYDPISKRGNATLSLGSNALLRLRLKPEQMKVLDYAYFSLETPMIDPPNPLEEESDADAHLWSAQSAAEPSMEKTVAAHELPIVLTVEVARLEMALDKLFALKPGNLLDLQVQPEQLVTLTVQGKRVAKGELVKVGDALGVRLVQIG